MKRIIILLLILFSVLACEYSPTEKSYYTKESINKGLINIEFIVEDSLLIYGRSNPYHKYYKYIGPAFSVDTFGYEINKIEIYIDNMKASSCIINDNNLEISYYDQDNPFNAGYYELMLKCHFMKESKDLEISNELEYNDYIYIKKWDIYITDDKIELPILNKIEFKYNMPQLSWNMCKDQYFECYNVYKDYPDILDNGFELIYKIYDPKITSIADSSFTNGSFEYYVELETRIGDFKSNIESFNNFPDYNINAEKLSENQIRISWNNQELQYICDHINLKVDGFKKVEIYDLDKGVYTYNFSPSNRGHVFKIEIIPKRIFQSKFDIYSEEFRFAFTPFFPEYDDIFFHKRKAIIFDDSDWIIKRIDLTNYQIEEVYELSIDFLNTTFATWEEQDKLVASQGLVQFDFFNFINNEKINKNAIYKYKFDISKNGRVAWSNNKAAYVYDLHSQTVLHKMPEYKRYRCTMSPCGNYLFLNTSGTYFTVYCYKVNKNNVEYLWELNNVRGYEFCENELNTVFFHLENDIIKKCQIEDLKLLSDYQVRINEIYDYDIITSDLLIWTTSNTLALINPENEIKELDFIFYGNIKIYDSNIYNQFGFVYDVNK